MPIRRSSSPCRCARTSRRHWRRATTRRIGAEHRKSRKRRSPRRRRTRSRQTSPPRQPREDVNIDLDGFEARAVVLPPKAGNYAGLQAVKGKLLYRASAAHRIRRTTKSPIVYFDFTEREEKTVLDDADGFEVTFDGKKMLVASKGKFAIVEIKPAQKFEKPMATGRHRGAGRSARGVAADVHGRVPLRARLLLRPEHARRRLGRRCRRATASCSTTR